MSISDMDNKVALLKFCAASTLEELRTAIFEACRQALPNAKDTVIFLPQSVCDAGHIENIVPDLPRNGIVWEAYQTRQRIVIKNIELSDPVCIHFTKGITRNRTVVCSPVIDENLHRAVGVLLISCDDLSDEDDTELQFIEQQIAVCFNRLKTTELAMADNCKSLDQAILKLCAELYDQESSLLQLKVINYLKQQTNSQNAFLLMVASDTQELFCQVVGDRVLSEEMRFPGATSSFAIPMETKQPTTLDYISEDNRKSIELFLGHTIESMLCVPIISPIDEQLIALPCVINKQNSAGYTKYDVQIIRHCFQYTATVLTSTLAFQNERKLKNETQALLQVARNLFTHLGELFASHMIELNKCHDFQLSLFDVCNGNQFKTLWDRKIAISCQQRRESKTTDDVSSEQLHKQLLAQEKLANKLTGQTLRSPEKADGYKVHSRIKSSGHTISSAHHHQTSPGPYSPRDRRSSDQGLSNDSEKTFKYENVNVATLDYTGSSHAAKDDSIAEDILDERRRANSLVDDIIAKSIHSILQEDKSNATSTDASPRMAGVDATIREMKPGALSLAIKSQSDTAITQKGNLPLGVSPRGSSSSSSCVLKVSSSPEIPLLAFRSISHLDVVGEDDSFFSLPVAVDSRPEFKNAFIANSCENLIGAITSHVLRDDAFLVHSYSSLPSMVDDHTSSPHSTMATATGDHSVHYSLDDIIGRKSDAYITVSEYSIEIENSDTNLKHTMSFRKCRQPTNNSDMEPIHQRLVWIPPLADRHMDSLQVPNTELRPFEHNDLTKLLREIMQEARNLTAAERCSVFLIDRETDELIAKVFDGITYDDSEIQTEIRLPITQGIAGHVAMRGELLNIKDAYSHPLFYRGIDDSTGFRTRNILCFPIKDEKGIVLGVAQLCNKKIGPCFTTFDEEIASAFAVYCCISISHSLMYKKLTESQCRQRLANELMIYHMQVTNEDVNSLISSDTPNPHHFHPEFDHYTYPPRVLNDNDSLLSCLSMFDDLGLSTRWRIKRETLGRFLLMVKRGYRNPPYHNWMHAFSVGHFCYLLNKNSMLLEYLDEIEIFALFVACLCHDIDHRGTNNSFQLESKSVLAALYSSEGSVMERHHFAQTMCIVNTDGCNIFENLSRKEYQQVLDLMRDIILATDLAHHLRILKSLQAMAEEGYDKTNYRHHKHLLCLMMTACDLSDQTKNWNNTKHIASLIYQEFFSQGDLEKEIGKKPMEMMDRERARIPDLQLSFLDHIALPVFRLLPKILTSTKYVQSVVEENRFHWQRISDHLKDKEGDTNKCMTMDELLSLDGGAVENGEPTNGNVC